MTELEIAEKELSSLLSKCEAVLRNNRLSPARTILMTNRVAALRTALRLVREARSARAADPSVPGCVRG